MIRPSGGEATSAIRPRVVFLSKTRLGQTVPVDLRRKFAILARYLEPIVLCVGPVGSANAHGSRIIRLPDLQPAVAGGLLFYSFGAIIGMALAVASKASAVLCQSPYEAVGTVLLARALPTRVRPKVIVEVHGDWRTAPRLYGSRLRQLVAPFADAASVWVLRRADRVRVVSQQLEDAVRHIGYTGPLDRFVTFSDYEMFRGAALAPLPAEPVAAFVGVFERYKAVDVLLNAWREVVEILPGAVLLMAGKGPLLKRLRHTVVRDGLSANVRFLGTIPRNKVLALLDSATCLVLPSRSEGLPRIILEAMARGRPVIASSVGGIPEVVIDGVNGYLVPSEDVSALSQALQSVLSDRGIANSMGREARKRLEQHDPARQYDAGIRRLATWLIAP